MALRHEKTAEMVSATAGLHAEPAWRQICRKPQQLKLRELLLQLYTARFILTYDVKSYLA